MDRGAQRRKKATDQTRGWMRKLGRNRKCKLKEDERVKVKVVR